MASKFKTQDTVARALRNARPPYYQYPFKEMRAKGMDEKTMDFMSTTHYGEVYKWLTTVIEVRNSLRDFYKSFNEERFLLLAGYTSMIDEVAKAQGLRHDRA